MLTDSVQNEYWFHVADQVDIPIAGTVDKSIDLDLLEEVALSTPKSQKDILSYINALILEKPDSIDMLRTLIGVSEKRMYLELSYAYSKAKYSSSDKVNILGYSVYELNKKSLLYFKRTLTSKDKKLSKKSSQIISTYLVERGLHKVLRAIKKIDRDELETLVDKLILTKEVQQAEAKRRGHGAEHMLSLLINGVGLQMLPSGRHINPMGSKDPNVDREKFEVSPKIKNRSWSFDLILQSPRGENFAFVQSLIHTSDPGQYGVNKSDETVSIKTGLNQANRKYGTKKELWGLVDGVGFCENKKDTIDKMLVEFDCFIQIKTLYKAALKLHKLGYIKIKAISFDSTFYNTKESDEMYDKYCASDIKNLNSQKPNSAWTPIAAGMATLFL